LIYEVLLLKIPSANRQFCDTGLLSFPALFESEPLSPSGGVSGAAVRAAGWGWGQGGEGADRGGGGGRWNGGGVLIKGLSGVLLNLE